MTNLDEVNVRELRNHGGRVLDRVAHGETLIVTKAGTAVAELRPVSSPRCTATELIARARRLPPMNPDQLRRDIDNIVDQTL